MSIPQHVGRYQVLGRLATGGMAEILLSKLTGPGGFQRAVVIKRVLPHLAERSEFRTMFLDEARIVAGLRHPNIVQVQELGEDGPELYLVMEYLEGEALSGLMKRLAKLGERLPPGVAAWIAAEACAGLHAAHEHADDDGKPQHIIHRDVSPQNVFVTYDGDVKVVDFGIAKAVERSSETSTGQLKGKFSYMAPEQCAREELDRRVDVFAMGIVLWEMITHRRLFARDNELQVMRAIVDDPIEPPSTFAPDCPPKLQELCLRALARDREERHPTADAMRRELLRVSRDLDPEGIPRERLGELMTHAFADRMAEKRDMLRQVRQGQRPPSIPPPEADRSDDASRREREPSTEATVPSVQQGAPPSGSKRRWLLGAAAAFVVIAGGVALVWWNGASAPETATAAAEPAAAASAPPDDGQVPEAAEAAKPEEPSSAGGTTADGSPAENEGQLARQVRIRIDTHPTGARVSVDGQDEGRSPVTLEMSRAEHGVELLIERRGYRPLRQQVVPDVDQKLLLSLERAPVRRRGRPSRAEERDEDEGDKGFFRID